MKNISNHAFTILVTAFALFASVEARAVPMVTLDPSSTSFLLGQPVNVNVDISGATGNPITAYDLNVTYDSSLLSPVGVSFGLYLGDPSLFEALISDTGVNTAPGVVDFAEVSLLSDADVLSLQAPANGAFTLATLQFTALQDGQSNFALVYGPGNDVKCANDQVCVPSIPEPPMAWLFGLGLMLLMCCRAKAHA
jgi:hypothetical protein